MNIEKTHWSAFILSNSVAFLLLLSWLTPYTRHYWDIIDAQVFYYLNGWVATNRAAQVFWAITNYRAFDIIPFLFLLSTVCVANFFLPKEKIKSVCILLIATLITLLIVRFLMHAFYTIDRHSASLSLKPAFLLRQLVPYIHSKDASTHSFPGDHASVIFVWVGFMFMFAKKPYKFLAILIGGLFILPRLVGGAHWFTDDVVGGLFIALIAISWTCFTPLARLCIQVGLPILNFILDKIVPEFILNLTFNRR